MLQAIWMDARLRITVNYLPLEGFRVRPQLDKNLDKMNKDIRKVSDETKKAAKITCHAY